MHEHSAHNASDVASDAHEDWDVVVIGGSAAGLAAALQLARSRRRVLVLDSGAPRNAPSAHMHSYLGHDGLPPSDFLEIARGEVERYGATIRDDTVADVAPGRRTGRFRIETVDGSSVTARRVLVATGLVDELPDIAGLAQQWGRGVLHCPYCHGWEVRDQQIVVIATGLLAAHQALLFRQLSDRVTVILHGSDGPSGEDRLRLAARGVEVVDGPVSTVLCTDEHIDGVRLADGRTIDAQAVVVAPRFVARCHFLAGLGIEAVPAPMGTGEVIQTDERGATSVAGVYAAGNVADVSGQVLHAAADGSRAGAMINADLAMEDADRAVAELPGDGPADWDRRYGAHEQLFSGHVNASLVQEAPEPADGTALDLGCGEGADAVWLAEAGWRVTAVDISAVAIDRGRNLAARAGVEIDWLVADVVTQPPGTEGFDLVSVHYAALRRSAGDDAERMIVGAVAPGGTLLMVGHDLSGHEHHIAFDPDDYVQPGDVARHLGDDWSVEVNEVRPRVQPPGQDGPHIADVVLKARRLR